MPEPAIQDVHIDSALTNIAVAYMQEASGFIADKVFPVVPVQKQSDRYFVYNKGDWFRIVAQERAPATESAGGGWRIDNTPTYYCRLYAVHKDVDDMTRANADSVINLDRDATEWVTQQILLKRETVWATNYLSTGVWGTDIEGSSSPSGDQVYVWSDYTNSDPLTDVENAMIDIAKTTGYKPNVLVVTPDVLSYLKNHPKILERVKYTQKGVITEDILAGLFGVDKFLVPWAVVNTASEGATDSINFIATKKALLAYAAPSPSLQKPSAGYLFVWTGLGGGGSGIIVKRYRMEHLAADRIEAESAFDAKVVASDLGVLFYNIV